MTRVVPFFFVSAFTFCFSFFSLSGGLKSTSNWFRSADSPIHRANVNSPLPSFSFFPLSGGLKSTTNWLPIHRFTDPPGECQFALTLILILLLFFVLKRPPRLLRIPPSYLSQARAGGEISDSLIYRCTERVPIHLALFLNWPIK